MMFPTAKRNQGHAPTCQNEGQPKLHDIRPVLKHKAGNARQILLPIFYFACRTPPLSVVAHTVSSSGPPRTASREFRRIGDIAINPARAMLKRH